MGTTAALLVQAGTVSVIFGAMLALVRIALGAERRRADDWRTAARTSAAANAVLTGHVETLIGSVGQLSTAQREMMSLLQAMSAEGRSAA
jgi:hypothetical protein